MEPAANSVVFKDNINLTLLQPETHVPLKEFESVKKALNHM